MDYTTPALVKAALRITEPTDDTLLARLVTAASRAIDRKVTGAPDSDAADYFELGAVADELLLGIVDQEGSLVCYPHKAAIAAVSALAHRRRPDEDWQTVPPARIEVERNRVVAWLDLGDRAFRRVRISYTGGLAATQPELPADLVEAATLLAARFYREDESGLSDSVGVAELGQMMYTKAWPVRLVEMLRPFNRVPPW
jgi:hypothetical protein